MNDQQEHDCENFSALLSSWKGAYQCAVCSYVAMKLPEGPRLLFGQVLLEVSRTGINEVPFKFETKHVVAGRFVMTATETDIANIIAKAKVGEMRTSDGVIVLTADTGVGGSLWIHFSPIYHPFFQEGPRLPSLLIRGISKYRLVTVGDARELDWELRAADTPFDTLDELLGYCGLPALTQMGDGATLEIVARSPGAIDASSTITGSDAVIKCRISKTLDVGKLRFGYRIFLKEQQVDRTSVSGDNFEWRDEGDLKVGLYRVPVGEASLLQALLSYDGSSLHQWWVTDPQKRLNPRHAIHQIFDQDLELLRKMLLNPETDKPYVFEGAVSTLLDLLGFSTSNYGRIPKLQKGPDIIAITSSGHVGIVECTVGLLSENDKLAKLVQRTKLIKEKLAETGYSYLQLQPVIVTPLSRDEVAVDLVTARDHGIAVVCKQDLEAALNRVGLPPDSDRVFQDAKKLIPVSDQPSLFQSNEGK